MASNKRIVRTPRPAVIDWSQAHAPVFSTNAAAIGLTPAQAANYSSAVTKAADALTAVTAAKQAWRSASAFATTKFRELSQITTVTVEVIDAFAQAAAEPGDVYELAQLLPPLTPSQMPPPGTPYNFNASLNTDGSVRITWKADNPAGSTGTVWIVRRKLLNQSVYTQVGLTGTKNFVDPTIPAASGGAIYTVQGQRGASIGLASSPFTVQFGVDGGGMVIASQFTGENKLAA